MSEAPSDTVDSTLRILIVEDNADAAWIMGRLLEVLTQARLDIACDGASALNKIAELRPHIVLLDIGLPGKDGFQIAREIRAQPQYDDLLLVALTGYGQPEDRSKSAEVGFDIHLLKPAGVDELQALLAHPKVASVPTNSKPKAR
jgi:CheY-like chemotaxis protein